MAPQGRKARRLQCPARPGRLGLPANQSQVRRARLRLSPGRLGHLVELGQQDRKARLAQRQLLQGLLDLPASAALGRRAQPEAPGRLALKAVLAWLVRLGQQEHQAAKARLVLLARLESLASPGRKARLAGSAQPGRLALRASRAMPASPVPPGLLALTVRLDNPSSVPPDHRARPALLGRPVPLANQSQARLGRVLPACPAWLPRSFSHEVTNGRAKHRRTDNHHGEDRRTL